MAAPQSSQAFGIAAVSSHCPLFPPQHFPGLLPTSVGHAELGAELSLALGHPLLSPKTSVPPRIPDLLGLEGAWQLRGGSALP